MGCSDLGFKTSERSGDDVSCRNGTNIPRRRPREACDLRDDDCRCDDMGMAGCGACKDSSNPHDDSLLRSQLTRELSLGLEEV